MGALVKGVLKRLCVEFGWSYAVFWKAIGCGDQMHLVWEDGHCERTSAAMAASGFEAMDLLIKESGVLRGSQNGGLSQLGSQAEDRVRTLVFKLMATQVHVVGEGIVGKAALMGNHEWLLGDVLADNGSISKVLAEINNQRLADIKTIAIIPVLPYGIVQLGSTQMILENLGFVNHVKGLFEQLQFVPGALLSSISDKNLCLKIQLDVSVGMQVAVKQYGEGGTNLNGLSSLNDDTRNCQHSSHLGSRAVTEPCDSSTQLYDHMSTNVPEIPLAKENMSSTMIPLSAQPMVRCATNPILHLNCKLKTGHREALQMFPNSDAMLLKDVLPCESNSRREYYPPTGSPYSRLTGLEEQLLSMSGIRQGEFANSSVSILDNTNMCQLQSYKCSSLNPLQGSDLMSSITRGQLLVSANDLGKFNSLNSTRKSFRSQCADSSSAEVPQVFNATDNSTFNQIFPGNLNPSRLNSTGKKSLSGSSTEKQKSNYSQVHALEGQSTQFDHGSSLCSLLGNPLQGSPLQENREHKNSACLENGSGHAPSRFGSKGNEKPEFLPSLDEKVSVSSLQPSSGNDLFDVLRLDQYKSWFSHGNLDNVKIHGTANAHELSTDISTCITELEDGPRFNALNDEICCSEMFSEADSDQLLDAVVSQFHQGYKYEMNDNASCKTSSRKMSNSSLHTSSPINRWVVSPKQMNAGILGLPCVPIKSELAASGSVKSLCSMERGEGCFPQMDHKSQINLWIEGQKMNCDNHSVVHGKKVDEAGKQNRKRSRQGENPRPRPKDRQMIQDRVKELREIVPNGAKCSIDALLENTIKHMLFLQSVTKHADKLKEIGEPKILSEEGGLLLKDNFEGGATWAFEVGSQSMICPIIVEDLNPPRQMLVEMLCEERGLFLEIADFVRGLGLTILKGVMEARNDKVWAHFAVEANRDVTRMEIFLSLVRLLEPSSGSNKAPECVGILNKPHDIFHSPSSIPATGVSDRIW